MEINPSLARLQQLQMQDAVQMQREAAPDDELAGCPGCPYFWTCPVPHRGEAVAAPEEIDVADVEEQLGPRSEFRPRDTEDIGWTDEWVEVDEDEPDDENPDGDAPAPRSGWRRLFGGRSRTAPPGSEEDT